jgi:4-amino-4-deoxy-L-arabinose transferase-like glycosyltransferase
MTISKNQFWFIISLGIIALLINNWSIGLWDQDEAAYAGFALRMIESGNYLIPEFYDNWSLIHRKPPLHFWNNVLFFKIFGANEFATRFSSVLSVIGTAGLVYYFGKRLYSIEIASIATVLAISSLLAFGLSKIAVTDADLLFFQTMALLSIYAYFVLGNNKYLIGVFIGTAGALLVKGPPVYIAGFGLIGLTFLFTKFKLKSIIVFGIMILAFGPLYLWGWSTWKLDCGEFVRWLVDWYILKRNKPFATQTGPPGYFFLIFLIGFVGWAGYYVSGFGKTISTIWKKSRWNQPQLLMLFWIIPGWILYEFMPSKLPAYAIAAYAPICFFTAKQLHENKIATRKIHRWLGAFFSLVLSLGIGISSILFLEGISLVTGICLSAFHVAYLMMYILRPENYNIKKGSLQIIITVIIAFVFIVPYFEPQRSAGKIVAEEIKALELEKIVITENLQIPSLLFYIEKQEIAIEMKYEKDQILANLQNYAQALLIINPSEKQKEVILSSGRLHKIISGWQMDRGRAVDYFILKPITDK